MDIEVIWQEYRSSLTRFLQSRISNSADVEDLLQEILIKSFTGLKSLKNTHSFKSWIFQIAHNVIVDYYRKKGQSHELLEAGLWEEQENDSDNSIHKQLSSCVIPFIQSLPQEHADLLMAIDIRGEKQKSLAEKKGISYSTLKSRVQKSRQLLKGVFDRCCQYNINSSGRIFDYEGKNKGCPCN